ncbi:gas vesicle protein [Peribacillus deserti]|uniref:Gas vesicle protein n=1 Tax=Peribacillus deserti TaxID=673318 RepID=A0ABS2QKH9_9BACI|nr:gas vesicle protein GvpP [Peribacillus deserti]MBM7693510.1 gas vesicle protein [Peribacillus deserti]
MNNEELKNNENENKNQEVSENNGENKPSENEKQTDEKKGANYSVNLAILGGVVGAGIGLLANPETSKKVMKNLGESELIKTAGKEFRKTAQELLAGQAQNSVKQLASGYISKIEEGLLSPKKGKGGTSGETSGESQSLEEIKEENKNLNERLQKMEKMLSDLVDSK